MNSGVVVTRSIRARIGARGFVLAALTASLSMKRRYSSAMSSTSWSVDALAAFRSSWASPEASSSRMSWTAASELSRNTRNDPVLA